MRVYVIVRVVQRQHDEPKKRNEKSRLEHKEKGIGNACLIGYSGHVGVRAYLV